MLLKKEIELASRRVSTDSYPVSIGEIVSIYNAGELNIHPEFQRTFRWDDDQKARLIESIFLGIPIPPIFVFQNDKGHWEVVDGLQRLSTIFEFMGVLKNEDDTTKPFLVLKATHFLPSLDGVQWESENPEKALHDDLRTTFKRKKLHFNILTPGSDENTKYDLFDRLNSGGSQLTEQEIRNCLIIMINRTLFTLISDLSRLDSFTSCLPLSQDAIDTQTDKEFVVRYFVARHINVAAIDTGANIRLLLTDRVKNLASNAAIDWEDEKTIFERTFTLLAKTVGENVFRKWNGNRYSGPILSAAFESIVFGLSSNIAYWETNSGDLEARIKSIYDHPDYLAATGRGIRATDRFKRLTTLSLELFRHGQN